MAPPKITNHTFSLTMTPAQYQAAAQKLSAAGHPVEGDSGTLNGPMGVVVKFTYQPLSQTLSVTIVHRPLLVSEETIAEKAEEWLGATPPAADS